jgi:RNA polymerase sigma factor (TIGR02999 family)
MIPFVACFGDPPGQTYLEATVVTSDVTRLLAAWQDGDTAAADKLLPLVYDELHRAAARAMRNEDAGHTLQPTALVNEMYLRLVDQTAASWKNRSQFFGVAAQAMRRILVDHARARLTDKRGGGARAVTLDELHDVPQLPGESSEIDLLSLNEALEKLAAFDPDQARIVELRYFAGLNIEETAEALGISTATVKREWVVARAWLKRELSQS